MKESDYDEHDLAFLVSWSLDETLPALERNRLEAALARSEELRREAEQLRAVQRLMARWAARPVEVDWDHHAALIVAQASSDDGALLDRVDGLVGRWANDPPPSIPIAFAEDVVRRLASRDHRPARFAAIFRLGVPLAAAAAIALAFVGPMWLTAPPPALSVVRFRTSVGAVPTTAHAVVAFGRTPMPGGAVGSSGGGVTFSVVGAGAMPSTYGDGPFP